MSRTSEENLDSARLCWRIGDVSVTRVTEFVLNYPGTAVISEATPDTLAAHDWLLPHFVTPAGELRMSIHALLVEAPGLKLVVDTCLGEDKGLPPLELLERHGDFLANLTAVGFAPEAVNMVFCTHMHADHLGWHTMLTEDGRVPTFPNARYLFGEKEYAWTASADEGNLHMDGPGTLQKSITPIVEAGLAEFVPSDHRISPQLRLIPTPGHTPGHVSLMIESRGEAAVITGDMIHSPCQIPHPEWRDLVDVEHHEAVRTRQAMLAEWEAKDTLVIGTHFAGPTAGRIVLGGDGVRQFRYLGERLLSE